MKSELRIDDVCALPGALARGFVTFDESAAGTLVRAPVILINGAEPGPTLVVTSGVHGDDLNTVPMTWRAAEQITPAELTGQVILVPVVNPVAFEAGSHLTPADNATPLVPGDPNGTISQRIGHHLYQKIVLRADYLIDMHGGSKRSTLAALAGVDGGADPAIIERAAAMAEAFDPDLVIIMTPKDDGPPGGMFQVSSRRGAPGLIIGMGQMGFNETDTVRGARGVLNVLKHLGMMPGKPERLANPRRTGSELYHHTPYSGGFIPAVRAAQPISEGDVLGTVLNIFGEVVGEVKAQTTGLVAAIRFYPVVSAGEWVASVARLA
jgi:predicted deacylase